MTDLVPANEVLATPQTVAVLNEEEQIQLDGLEETFDDEALDIIGSKRWVAANNSRIRFDNPYDMVVPFADLVNGAISNPLGEVFHQVKGSHTVINENDDGSRNVSYGRVSIESRINGEIPIDSPRESDRFREVIGMVYAFDLGTPEVTVFHGTRASSCLNLMIFGPTNVRKFNYAQDGFGSAHNMIAEYVESIGKEVDRQADIIMKLMNTVWSKDDVHRNIGKMFTHVINNNSFGQAALVSAVKDLTNPKSVYSLAHDGTTTAWNFLQALTQYVTNKAYLNIAPIKTGQMTDHILSLN